MICQLAGVDSGAFDASINVQLSQLQHPVAVGWSSLWWWMASFWSTVQRDLRRLVIRSIPGNAGWRNETNLEALH